MNGNDEAHCYRIALEFQRLIDFTEALGMRERTAKLSQGEWYQSGMDHSRWFSDFGRSKNYVVLDSPYLKNELHTDWRSIWLPRQCDPYYPGVSYPRLSVYKTSTANLEELVERVSHLNFKLETETNAAILIAKKAA